MQIYSTLSREKHEFVPRDQGKVAIYVCGPTVYDDPHLGHARSTIVFDAIRRYLIFRGYDVTYVSNFTDVDDRIINRAHEEGIEPAAVAERYIESWIEYMNRLGVMAPDIAPRATAHIPQMIELIEKLIAAGKAYEANGDVYFSIASFEPYGALSGRKIEELEAGARVEPGEHKHDPMDFALWKASKPGEPSWESPWGPGRPGWHIECSAMSEEYLGEGFDIHGGGHDLIFPHHENERAQSEALGGEFAHIWMHNGLVNLEGEKMSKSTGQFVSLAEILERSDPQVVRLMSLQSHYRRPVDFGPSEIDQASAALERIQEFDRRARQYGGGTEPGDANEEIEAHRQAFIEAMDDDFNTPEAIAEIFELVRAGNNAIDSGRPKSEVGGYMREVEDLCEVLGLDARHGAEAPLGAADALVDLVLSVRDEARQKKDWELADRLRDAVADLGVVVEDSSDGAVWHWRSPGSGT